MAWASLTSVVHKFVTPLDFGHGLFVICMYVIFMPWKSDKNTNGRNLAWEFVIIYTNGWVIHKPVGMGVLNTYSGGNHSDCWS